MSATQQQLRTRAFLANFAGNRDEFQMLKGVLCMGHALSGKDAQLAAALFDTVLIAERMDELNAAGRHRQP